MAYYTWDQILLFFFLYCFLGWIFESVYVSIMEHRFTNRGFLRGPAIPIYGFGAMMIVFATTPFRGNYLAEFIAGMLAATLFEYVVGVVMEAIFKIRYWDYSHKPFQYRGYICLESSLCWGVLSVVAAELLQVRMEQLVLPLPQQLSVGLACVLSAVFCTDTVVSVRDAWGVRNLVIALEKMKADLEQLQLDVEERSEEFIHLLEERLTAKKAELEQFSQERREDLAQEITQLRIAIEKEKQERELARAQFSVRIERDVMALQMKLEQEREGFYEKLQQARMEHEERKLSQTAKGNLLLQSLAANEEQLNILVHKRGNILQRNPNAMSRKLGNLRKHAERQAQRKKSQEKQNFKESRDA
ncbi:MAG: hypothetical protein ACI3U1_03445 [Peptococcaceae bacterium]